MTYVLVHGGGMTARCWDPLLPHLGEPAVAVDLPGRAGDGIDVAGVAVADFVDRVVDVIEGADLHDVVLVGHSLAGITLPGVAAAVPDRLRRLVFVSAAVPPDGGTVGAILGTLGPELEHLAVRLGDDLVDPSGTLHADLAIAMFCNDLDDAGTAFVLEGLSGESLAVLDEPVGLSGLGDLPRTYVRLLQDASIVLATQDRMVEHLGGPGVVDVVDIDAGHMVMMGDPAALAAVLRAC